MCRIELIYWDGKFQFGMGWQKIYIWYVLNNRPKYMLYVCQMCLMHVFSILSIVYVDHISIINSSYVLPIGLRGSSARWLVLSRMTINTQVVWQKWLLNWAGRVLLTDAKSWRCHSFTRWCTIWWPCQMRAYLSPLANALELSRINTNNWDQKETHIDSHSSQGPLLIDWVEFNVPFSC